MHSVILAGTIDRPAPWTRGVGRASLALSRKTVVQTLAEKLLTASDEGVSVCVHDDSDPIATQLRSTGVQIIEDRVPLGTAGCLKKCAAHAAADTFLIVGASVYLDDDPAWLLAQHQQSGNVLTVFCEHDPEWMGPGNEKHVLPTGVFCCNRSVLDYVREEGFQDLKEQVVPLLKRAGLRVGVIRVARGTRQISDWSTYIEVLGLEISGHGENGYRQLAPDIWCGENVQIAPDARVVGPALIGPGTIIESNSMLVGPLLLGAGCHVGADSWLVRVVAPSQIWFRQGCSLTDRMIPSPESLPDRSPTQAANKSSSELNHEHERVSREPWLRPAAAAIAVFAAFVWAFAPTINNLIHPWQSSADNGADMIVPAAAAYMVATRSKKLVHWRLRFSVGGLGFFFLGLLTNVAGNLMRYSSLQNMGLVTCAVGLIWSLAGLDAIRRHAFPLLFLYLMCPLPHRIQDAAAMPLQSACASISAKFLETFGVPIDRFGHVLGMAGKKIVVAEASIGLRIATIFLIVTAVVTYLIRKPRWQKAIVLLSCAPIALACNVIRIMLCVLLYNWGYDRFAQGFFQNGIVLLMVPVALAMNWLEFRVLSNLAMTDDCVPALVESVEQRRLAG